MTVVIVFLIFFKSFKMIINCFYNWEKSILRIRVDNYTFFWANIEKASIKCHFLLTP